MHSITTPIVPQEELAARHELCRSLLAQLHPEAGGIMAFSRPMIYYLCGCMGAGVFWLPREGQPVLMIRKGAERALLENPFSTVTPFRSFRELARLAGEHGVPLTETIAAERSGLPWNLGDSLQRYLPETRFVDGDSLLARARARKSPWELARMREAGTRHAAAMEDELPRRIAPGMSELEIARLLSGLFYVQGSCGITRMSSPSEEMHFGYVSAGESGNYPTFYNGPLGCRGVHPAAPFMGNAQVLWTYGQILAIDTGFCFEGYHSDKTLTYFAGAARKIPPLVRKAHAVCLAIEETTAEAMRPGAVPSKLYAEAVRKAEEAGFAQGFMGFGANKVPFLGHGVGLCIDEWPVLARSFEQPLETGMTLALEPKIGIPGIGMVGTENTWEVAEKGAICLSGGIRDIICVD